jgi:hypothetical protein
MLGHRAISECAIGALPIVEPSPIPGKLRKQYYQALAELPRAASVAEWLGRWRLVLNAVGEALPSPPLKVDKALARYDELVAAGHSTERQHHWKLKEDAAEGFCTVRALEMALKERAETK